jgi:hypothetical protein
MNNLNTNERPRWVMIASIILLIWNLIGIGAFFAQWNVAHNALDTLSPGEQAMWREMPGWAWAAYGIAVAAGALGAIGLVLRKAWAVPLLALSLIAVLIQFFNAFVLQDGIATVGANAVFFPLFIIAVGIVQWVLSRRWKAAGWLS